MNTVSGPQRDTSQNATFALKSDAIWSWRKALRPMNSNHMTFMRKADGHRCPLFFERRLPICAFVLLIKKNEDHANE